MQYDFDEVIERRGTGALKYEALLPRWGRDDLIPLWVADMDFRTPPFIMEAIRRRCEHEILGYTVKPRAFFEAIRDWVDRRHGWKVNASEIGFAPGIVPGISSAIQCFTEPGDKIMIQPPVYHPFAMIIRENGREIVNNPLILENGRYRMDFNHMQEAVRGCRMFILCNPHNPAGRVWTRDELVRLGEICRRNHVTVISDEIHCELVFPGHTYLPFASISDQHLWNSVTCISPSKSFNLAGLQIANIIARDDALRQRIDRAININEVCDVNPFGVEATIAAYNQGEEWLMQLLGYLHGNYEALCEFFGKYLPQIAVTELEGTYLVWTDCRKLGLSSDVLQSRLLAEAGVWLNSGTMYGAEGEGFMRWNIACPRSVLAQAMERFRDFVDSLQK